MKSQPEKVIAVVVTHNRLQLLSQCVAALKNQTRKLDKILVINNGSTDGTEQWLKEQKEINFINQDNLGGAGGFNTGIKTGYNEGYHWIWLMDDDGFPKEDAVEKLLAHQDKNLLVRNCSIISKDDKESFVWKTKSYQTINEVKDEVIPNIAHFFNGTLIHRNVIDKVGFPKAELFLWGDETEYYYRIIKQNNFSFGTIVNSIHYHPSISVSYKQNWDYKTGWKMYFYIRNRFHVHKSKFYRAAPLACLMYAGFLVAFAASTLAYQKTDKLKKLTFIFWPAKDAFANNFDATPASILERLKNREGSNTQDQNVLKMLLGKQPPLQQLFKKA